MVAVKWGSELRARGRSVGEQPALFHLAGRTGQPLGVPSGLRCLGADARQILKALAMATCLSEVRSCSVTTKWRVSNSTVLSSLVVTETVSS